MEMKNYGGERGTSEKQQKKYNRLWKITTQEKAAYAKGQGESWD